MSRARLPRPPVREFAPQRSRRRRARRDGAANCRHGWHREQAEIAPLVHAGSRREQAEIARPPCTQRSRRWADGCPGERAAELAPRTCTEGWRDESAAEIAPLGGWMPRRTCRRARAANMHRGMARRKCRRARAAVRMDAPANVPQSSRREHTRRHDGGESAAEIAPLYAWMSRRSVAESSSRTCAGGWRGAPRGPRREAPAIASRSPRRGRPRASCGDRGPRAMCAP